MNKKLIYILMNIFPLFLMGQVRFEVEIEKSNLKVGESTQINYIFSGNGDDFSPPSFKGFNIGGSYQSNNYTNINGVASAQTSYSFIIQATKPGKFFIEPASIYYRGKIVNSKGINITVANGKTINQSQNLTSAPTKTNKVQNKNNGNVLFIEAQTNKDNAFLNEPVVVEYVIFIDPRIQIEAGIETKPKYNGFWSQTEDISSSQWQQTSVGNRVYYSKVFKKALLYPQKTGKLVIDPLSINFNIKYPTGETDFFGNQDYEIIEKNITSNTKTLTINNLPEKGKPKDFTGAVGNFNFDVTIDKQELKSGETIQMNVVVSGSGNLKLFDLPKPNLPKSFEIFEPEHQEKVTDNINGINGKIIDTYNIIPQQNGWFNLPNQQFSFFDPSTESYKTIQTKSVNINVLKGENTVKKSITSNNSSTESIETESNFEKSNYSILNETYSNIALFLPLICLPLFILVKKKKEEPNPEHNSKKKAYFTKNKAINYLETSEKNWHDKTLFYNSLEIEMNQFYNSFFKSENLNANNLYDVLEQKSIDFSIISKVKNLNSNIELAKYAPISDENKVKDLQLAKEIINLITT
jgi:hypothetical protein